jgi:hypothetical protein
MKRGKEAWKQRTPGLGCAGVFLFWGEKERKEKRIQRRDAEGAEKGGREKTRRDANQAIGVPGGGAPVYFGRR